MCKVMRRITPTLSHDIYMDKDMLKYEVPRQIYFVPEFVYTDNQKIRRDENRKEIQTITYYEAEKVYSLYIAL